MDEQNAEPVSEPLSTFAVLVRHSPIAAREFTIEGTDKADALKRLKALYPTVRDDEVTWSDA